MALEKAGSSFNVNKLVKKLEKLYPEYDFSKPTPLDREHKAPYLCKENKIFYTDMDGNLCCATRFKKQDGVQSHKWEWATCHAVISTPEERVTYEQGDIF